jgi:hypothetical protein
MNQINKKLLRRFTKNRKLVGELRQEAAMKVTARPSVPDKFAGLATQVQGCPSILERYLPTPE